MAYSEKIAMDIFLKIFLGSYGVMLLLELTAWKLPKLKWLSKEWYRACTFIMLGIIVAMVLNAKVEFYPQYGNYSYNIFSLRFVGKLNPDFQAAPTPESLKNASPLEQYQQAFLQEDFKKVMCNQGGGVSG